MSSDQEKRERLEEIEQDLEGIRREFPTRTGDPQDFADAGADLAQREELEAQIETLVNERDRLRAELGLD